MIHPDLAALAAAYLGSEAVDLDAVTLITAPEGSGRQSMHRDVLEPRAVVLTVQVVLEDLTTPDGGALSLIAGSHATDHACDLEGEPGAERGGGGAVAHAVLGTSPRAGSVVVYDARTCHCGAENVKVPGDRPVLYVLFKRRTARKTGYLPFELNMRFGRLGLETVLQYREAFRASCA
eukprot:226245-Prymnesium_polylepis.1